MHNCQSRAVRRSPVCQRFCALIPACVESDDRFCALVEPTSLRQRPSVVRRLILALLAPIGLAACSSSTGLAPEATYATVVASTSAANSTSVRDHRIVDWLSRTHGRTISYTAVFSCGVCSIAGTWQVTELDGVISQAKFMDDGEMPVDARPFTLTDALTESTTATGRVTVVSSSATAIHLKVDPVVDSVDDEFEYDAQMIAIQE
jgi:hypothetical protein